ncbi:MAG: SDR family oxidoreductase [Pseudomonadota bacterium]
MLMRVADRTAAEAPHSGRYCDLTEARVALAGVSPDLGGDVALAFADHGAKLDLTVSETAPETDALLSVLAASGADISARTTDGADAEPLATATAAAAKAFGALDVAVHCVTLADDVFDNVASFDDLEVGIADALGDALRAAEVAANRMGLLWSDGLVLTVLRMPAITGPAAQVFSGLVRHAIAASTKDVAERAADHGVRVNAVLLGGPPPAPGAEPPQSAADIALYLASKAGRSMTGLVFDAAD